MKRAVLAAIVCAVALVVLFSCAPRERVTSALPWLSNDFKPDGGHK